MVNYSNWLADHDHHKQILCIAHNFIYLNVCFIIIIIIILLLESSDAFYCTAYYEDDVLVTNISSSAVQRQTCVSIGVGALCNCEEESGREGGRKRGEGGREEGGREGRKEREGKRMVLI